MVKVSRGPQCHSCWFLPSRFYNHYLTLWSTKMCCRCRWTYWLNYWNVFTLAPCQLLICLDHGLFQGWCALYLPFCLRLLRCILGGDQSQRELRSARGAGQAIPSLYSEVFSAAAWLEMLCWTNISSVGTWRSPKLRTFLFIQVAKKRIELPGQTEATSMLMAFGCMWG